MFTKDDVQKKLSYKRYSPSHEWVVIEEREAVVGITRYAKEELGEIVYVEFPSIGAQVSLGEEVVVLESTKAAADLYAPLSGKIIEVNEALRTDLSRLNQDPEGSGWLFKMELVEGRIDETLLLDQAQYESMIQGS